METHLFAKVFYRRFCCWYVAMMAALVVLAGCSGTEEYRQLAQVGTGYAQAMQSALQDYRSTYLDARSEQFLADTALINAGNRQPGRLARAGEPTRFDIDICHEAAATNPLNPALTPFAQRQCMDIRRVIIVSRLIAHTQLFGEYFNQLGKLAASDAPQAAGAAAGRIADGIKAIGTVLDRTVPGQIAALGPLARAVTTAIQRAELRNELERNQELIRRELAIEAKTLNYLKKQAEAEQKALFDRRFDRLVSAPVRRGDTVQQADRWVENRRALLLETDQVASIEAAERALKSLEKSYEALAAGGDARSLLDQALADIAMVLDVVEPLVGRKE